MNHPRLRRTESIPSSADAGPSRNDAPMPGTRCRDRATSSQLVPHCHERSSRDTRFCPEHTCPPAMEPVCQSCLKALTTGRGRKPLCPARRAGASDPALCSAAHQDWKSRMPPARPTMAAMSVGGKAAADPRVEPHPRLRVIFGSRNFTDLSEPLSRLELETYGLRKDGPSTSEAPSQPCEKQQKTRPFSTLLRHGRGPREGPGRDARGHQNPPVGGTAG